MADHLKILILLLIFSFEITTTSLRGYEIEIEAGIAAGYRSDNLHWTVSSLPYANVLTEEKWDPIQIFQIYGKADAYICDVFYLRGEADYGWIGQGKKNLDEFDLDGIMTWEKEGWLQADTKGHVYDFSGGVGYSFGFFSDCLQWMPLAGYSFHAQKFKDRRYRDKMYLVNFFEEVRSSYTYYWSGPWIGFYTAYLWDNDFKLSFEYQYHFGCYHAKIEDNLVSYVDNETQKNHHVHGHDLTLGIFYPHWECWTIGLVGNYKYWVGKHGTNQVDDQSFALKNVTWRSLSALFNVSYHF